MTGCRETVATSDCLKTSGFCRKPGAWQNGNVLNSFAKKKLFGQALTAKISTPWPFIGIGKFGFQSINLKFWRSKTMGSLEATRFSPPPPLLKCCGCCCGSSSCGVHLVCRAVENYGNPRHHTNTHIYPLPQTWQFFSSKSLSPLDRWPQGLANTVNKFCLKSWKMSICGTLHRLWMT